jgi:hypothetical protein
MLKEAEELVEKELFYQKCKRKQSMMVKKMSRGSIRKSMIPNQFNNKVVDDILKNTFNIKECSNQSESMTS